MLLLLVTTVGCGFLFTKGPPAGHEQMNYFTCTESNTGPILDVIYAGVNAAWAVAAIAESDASGNAYWDDYREAAIVGGISGTVIWGAAAVVGVDKSNKCRAAKRALAERLAGQQATSAEPQAAGDIVNAVVISPARDSLLLGIGEQVQLVATAYNAAGGMVGNKVFAWSSSNGAVAAVSNTGRVTAHATGAVVIAANTDKVVGTARIVVASQR
jgi:uncharacterized protein YjdB